MRDPLGWPFARSTGRDPMQTHLANARALRSELDHANNNVHRTRAAASAPPGRIRTLICLVDETQPPS
jgi:hypothetical protein